MDITQYIAQLEKRIEQQEEIISLQRKLIANYEGVNNPKKKYTYKCAGFPELKELLKNNGEDKILIAAKHNCAVTYINMLLAGSRNAKTTQAKAIIADLETLASINREAHSQKLNSIAA